MNHAEFDLTVIGGGCIGSSILHELALKGHPGLALIDQGRKSLSATSHSGGMLRVFHEAPEHVELALGNHARLRGLENAGLITRGPSANGHLYFFNKERFTSYAPALKKMSDADYPFEVIKDAQGRERFPDFNWSRDEWAVYEPLAGHRNPTALSDELLALGRNRGAEVFESHEVIRICPYLDRYRIACDKGTITTKSLVLAGGARLLPRLSDLRISLPLEKKVIKTFTAAKKDENLILPNFFERETLGFGRMGQGPSVVLSQQHATRLKETLWESETSERSMEDCYAPNRMGIAGMVPGHSRLLLATGWGGTAFKFALEIGNKVAQYAS